MNKAEKAQRKAWKKEARALAEGDLDGLISMQKTMAVQIKKLRRRIVLISVASVVLIIASFFVGLIL